MRNIQHYAGTAGVSKYIFPSKARDKLTLWRQQQQFESHFNGDSLPSTRFDYFDRLSTGPSTSSGQVCWFDYFDTSTGWFDPFDVAQGRQASSFAPWGLRRVQTDNIGYRLC